MNALVTGGAGFIGSHLVEALLRRGDSVQVVDDLSTGRFENIAHLEGHPKFDYVIDTILDERVVSELTANIDVVFHLAAAVGVAYIIDNPLKSLETNIRGTEIVLQQANEAKKKVVIFSTSEIYGKAGDQLHEEADRLMGSTTHRRWAYACTKALDEFLALAYHRERGLPVILGRFFNTVGPRQTGQWGMVLPNLVGQALRGDPIRVFGSGEQQRCFCMVDDTVRAILGLIGHEDAWGHPFNIGSEEEVTIRELAERVKARLASPSPIELVPYDVAYGEGFEDMQRRKPDTGRIRALIGWQAEHSLDRIIDLTAEHLRTVAAA